MLYDSRFPNAGLFDKSGALTSFGVHYVSDLRDN
jgi:hypothetical protein